MNSFLKRVIKLECRLCNHLMFWFLILFFHTFFPTMYSNQSWYEVLLYNAYYTPFDVIAVYITIYLLIPKLLLKGKTLKFTISIILLIFMLFLNTLLGVNVIFLENSIEKVSVFKLFFQSTATSTFIIALASAIKILKYYHSIKLEKVNIENINLQNELVILKNQITPHFFFNTLNNIDELIYIDREKASAAIYQLSSILRSMLGEMSNDKVMLETEIKFIENYLRLASYNFKKPDSISIKKIGNVNGKSIAPMLFLPLIENAIKYSDRSADGKVINIEINVNGTLSFSIQNKTKEVNNMPNSTGIGLNNLKKRLQHIYPGRYKLDINNEGGVFSVDLEIEI